MEIASKTTVAITLFLFKNQSSLEPTCVFCKARSVLWKHAGLRGTGRQKPGTCASRTSLKKMERRLARAIAKAGSAGNSSHSFGAFSREARVALRGVECNGRLALLARNQCGTVLVPRGG